MNLKINFVVHPAVAIGTVLTLAAAACGRQSEVAQSSSSASRGATAGNADLSVDEDGDGVPDVWEESGVDVKLPSGTSRYLDLRGAGGSSRHKDI